MKKLILLFMTIISVFSFSWEVGKKLDKFGDPTEEKVLIEKSSNQKESYLIAEKIDYQNDEEDIKNIKLGFVTKDFYKFKFINPSRSHIKIEIKIENKKIFKILAKVDKTRRAIYFYDKNLIKEIFSLTSNEKITNDRYMKIAIKNVDDTFSVYKFNFKGIHKIFDITNSNQPSKQVNNILKNMKILNEKTTSNKKYSANIILNSIEDLPNVNDIEKILKSISDKNNKENKFYDNYLLIIHLPNMEITSEYYALVRGYDRGTTSEIDINLFHAYSHDEYKKFITKDEEGKLVLKKDFEKYNYENLKKADKCRYKIIRTYYPETDTFYGTVLIDFEKFLPKQEEFYKISKKIIANNKNYKYYRLSFILPGMEKDVSSYGLALIDKYHNITTKIFPSLLNEYNIYRKYVIKQKDGSFIFK